MEALATRLTVLEARDVRPGDGAHSSSLGILESTAFVVFLPLEAELDPGYPEQRPIEEMLGLSTRADWLNFCEAFEDGRLEATWPRSKDADQPMLRIAARELQGQFEALRLAGTLEDAATRRQITRALHRFRDAVVACDGIGASMAYAHLRSTLQR